MKIHLTGARLGVCVGFGEVKQESTHLPQSAVKTKGIAVLAEWGPSPKFGGILYPLGRSMARRGHRPGCGVGFEGKVCLTGGQQPQTGNPDGPTRADCFSWAAGAKFRGRDEGPD